ncbi:MAG TPA: type 2 lanthipeptide synthetase LanM, partial [archaeon]|nr:type 2 lanthipeptide synthetase LanM [archaeon]
FFSLTSDSTVACEGRTFIRGGAVPGLKRAQSRLDQLDRLEIEWQLEIIRQSTTALKSTFGEYGVTLGKNRIPHCDPNGESVALCLKDEVGAIYDFLSNRAIRKGAGAAWIGLDWLGDSDVCNVIALGPDLYNGVVGIAVFLAAYARFTSNIGARRLALGSVSAICKDLHSPTAARIPRIIGVGGSTGLGSIVYGLATIANLLNDQIVAESANVAANLISREVVSADKSLDVFGGSAGAILGLLSLYRAIPNPELLERAIHCGEHLLRISRFGTDRKRTWGIRNQVLNGMSHGASGFALALSSLGLISRRDDFSNAAIECILYEKDTYDPTKFNWPDRRENTANHWSCQWCHGAAGIGLARLGILKQQSLSTQLIMPDIENALQGVELNWPNPLDSLCCGTLGTIEFIHEAGIALSREDLHNVAKKKLFNVIMASRKSGDYEWGFGDRQFNLGLFRGLAGVGYTILRQLDSSLPNVLIWE